MFWHLSNSLVRQSTGNRTYPISGNCGWIVLAFMSAESRRRYRISANEIPLRFLETGEQLCKGWARLLLTADLDRCRSLRIDGPNCEHCKLQNLVDCPVHLGWDYFRLVPLLFRGEHGSQDFLQRLHHSRPQRMLARRTAPWSKWLPHRFHRAFFTDDGIEQRKQLLIIRLNSV